MREIIVLEKEGKRNKKKKKINVGQGKLICKHFGRETE